MDLDLEPPSPDVEVEVEMEVVAQEEEEEEDEEAEAELVDFGCKTSSHRSQFVLCGDRLLPVDGVVEGVNPPARDGDPDLEDEDFVLSPITPTYISGPLFVRTSWKRHRRGQLDGFPGRGSLGQIQPRVWTCGAMFLLSLLILVLIWEYMIEYREVERNKDKDGT